MSTYLGSNIYGTNNLLHISYDTRSVIELNTTHKSYTKFISTNPYINVKSVEKLSYGANPAQINYGGGYTTLLYDMTTEAQSHITANQPFIMFVSAPSDVAAARGITHFIPGSYWTSEFSFMGFVGTDLIIAREVTSTDRSFFPATVYLVLLDNDLVNPLNNVYSGDVQVDNTGIKIGGKNIFMHGFFSYAPSATTKVNNVDDILEVETASVPSAPVRKQLGFLNVIARSNAYQFYMDSGNIRSNNIDIINNNGYTAKILGTKVFTGQNPDTSTDMEVITTLNRPVYNTVLNQGFRINLSSLSLGPLDLVTFYLKVTVMRYGWALNSTDPAAIKIDFYFSGILGNRSEIGSEVGFGTGGLGSSNNHQAVLLEDGWLYLDGYRSIDEGTVFDYGEWAFEAYDVNHVTAVNGWVMKVETR